MAKSTTKSNKSNTSTKSRTSPSANQRSNSHVLIYSMLGIAVFALIGFFVYRVTFASAAQPKVKYCKDRNVVLSVNQNVYAPCVKSLQSILAGEAQRGVDGIFGPKTKKKVQDYQRQKGLVVDGIVGPKTWAAIYADTQLTGE